MVDNLNDLPKQVQWKWISYKFTAWRRQQTRGVEEIKRAPV